MKAKRGGFLLIFGFGLVAVRTIEAIATGGLDTGRLVGGLIAGALGCGLAATWYRARLRRQRGD